MASPGNLGTAHAAGKAPRRAADLGAECSGTAGVSRHHHRPTVEPTLSRRLQTLPLPAAPAAVGDGWQNSRFHRESDKRQRLLTRSRAQQEEFQLVLTRDALERLLYRLSQSPHRDVHDPG